MRTSSTHDRLPSIPCLAAIVLVTFGWIVAPSVARGGSSGSVEKDVQNYFLGRTFVLKEYVGKISYSGIGSNQYQIVTKVKQGERPKYTIKFTSILTGGTYPPDNCNGTCDRFLKPGERVTVKEVELSGKKLELSFGTGKKKPLLVLVYDEPIKRLEDVLPLAGTMLFDQEMAGFTEVVRSVMGFYNDYEATHDPIAREKIGKALLAEVDELKRQSSKRPAFSKLAVSALERGRMVEMNMGEVAAEAERARVALRREDLNRLNREIDEHNDKVGRKIAATRESAPSVSTPIELEMDLATAKELQGKSGDLVEFMADHAADFSPDEVASIETSRAALSASSVELEETLENVRVALREEETRRRIQELQAEFGEMQQQRRALLNKFATSFGTSSEGSAKQALCTHLTSMVTNRSSAVELGDTTAERQLTVLQGELTETCR